MNLIKQYLSLFLLFSFLSFASDKVEYPKEINFTDVKAHLSHKKNISIKNISSKELKISKVRSSCGCTVADYPKEAIAPGSFANIRIKFSSNKIGPTNKNIYIFIEGDTSSYPITVKANVIRNLEYEEQQKQKKLAAAKAKEEKRIKEQKEEKLTSFNSFSAKLIEKNDQSYVLLSWLFNPLHSEEKINVIINTNRDISDQISFPHSTQEKELLIPIKDNFTGEINFTINSDLFNNSKQGSKRVRLAVTRKTIDVNESNSNLIIILVLIIANTFLVLLIFKNIKNKKIKTDK